MIFQVIFGKGFGIFPMNSHHHHSNRKSRDGNSGRGLSIQCTIWIIAHIGLVCHGDVEVYGVGMTL